MSPYKVTDPDLPSNVKKLPAKKKKAWVATWNNVYDTCVSDGGDKSTCETKAFKVANGNAKKQTAGSRAIFRDIFEVFLNFADLEPEPEPPIEVVDRATSLERIYSQLYAQLREGDEWAYPVSMYVEDNQIFCLVAQGGKIFRVPLSVSNDNVTMGDWIRVEESFTPVTEQSFRVRRQKDGKYRWIAIAGTTVLNRVGEIDSSELFDSFVEYAERTGEYPRLDFYHLGGENPEAWEFGTADYLAREGVCYIASGTFDEDHPLAKATIQAAQKDDAGKWGNSVEFYASVKPEMIVADPEVKVPVYKRGRNSRISLVLEEDAAGLFTHYGVEQGVIQTMDAKTTEKLKELFGSDEAGMQVFLNQFESSVDGVNRTVKDDNLIHRAKTDTSELPPEVEEEGEDDEEKDDGIDGEELTIDQVIAEVTQSKDFKALADGIADLKKMVAGLVVERENDKKEIARLNQSVTTLSKDEDEKKQEYLQDLPRSKRTHITHRPREMHDDSVEGPTMDTIASRTLNGIPGASRY